MAKIYTDEEIRYLRENPNVRVIRHDRLSLTYEFRCHLYDAYMANGRSGMRAALEQAGIPCKMVGPGVIRHLCGNFDKRRPVNCSGTASSTRKHPNTPQEIDLLVSSGAFVRKNNGISFSDDFVSYVDRHYPDVTVGSALKEFGIDPDLVGYHRIRKLTRQIEGKDGHRSCIYDAAFIDALKDNRFVRRITSDSLRLSPLFYQIAHRFARLDLSLILDAFGIPSDQLSYMTKYIISKNLIDWKGETGIEEADDEIIRICGKLADALIPVLEKELSSFLTSCEPRVKKRMYEALYDMPHACPLSSFLKRSGIARSTFYGVLKNERYGHALEKQREKDRDTADKIRRIIDHDGYQKGTRCVSMMSRQIIGEHISRRRAQRIMRKEGLLCTLRKPCPAAVAARRQAKANKKQNHVRRAFRLHRPYDLVFTDVTYIDYGSGKRAYLSPILDCAGEVISYAVSESQDLSMIFAMLDDIRKDTIHEGTVFHSDQGALYMSDQFQERLKEMGLIQSMSRRGNCWDNAAMESFFGHLKDHCHFAGCATFQEVKKMIDDYIEYYNNERPQWTRMKMTPAAYARYLKEMDEQEFEAYLAKERQKYEQMIARSIERTDKHGEHLRSVISSLVEETR